MVPTRHLKGVFAWYSSLTTFGKSCSLPRLIRSKALHRWSIETIFNRRTSLRPSLTALRVTVTNASAKTSFCDSPRTEAQVISIQYLRNRRPSTSGCSRIGVGLLADNGGKIVVVPVAMGTSGSIRVMLPYHRFCQMRSNVAPQQLAFDVLFHVVESRFR